MASSVPMYWRNARLLPAVIACRRMARVLVTRPIPERGLERLRAAGHEVEVWRGAEPMPRVELLARIADADAILTAVANVVDGEVIAAAARLRIVANMGVGFDNVDRASAQARGIAVTNTPEVLTETTADMAFGMLIAAARRIAEAAAIVRAGTWDLTTAPGLLGEEVNGATLGIVGLGRIGRAVARRAQGFSMRVLYTDPAHTPEMKVMEAAGQVARVELPELLARADFVSLHPDLNPMSRGLIGAAALASMKKTAILVNVSRGPVVETAALAEALEAGRIAGCALDVTDPEPLPAGHPLRTHARALVTPHMSTQSRETREKMSALAAENIIEVLAGRPPRTPIPTT